MPAPVRVRRVRSTAWRRAAPPRRPRTIPLRLPCNASPALLSWLLLSVVIMLWGYREKSYTQLKWPSYNSRMQGWDCRRLVARAALIGIMLCTLGVSTPFQVRPAPGQQTGLLFDDIYLRHLAGNTGHPERPERLIAIRDGLERAGLLKSLYRIAPRPITDQELELVHKPSYVALVRRELRNLQGLKELSTGDTLASTDSLRAAEFAAGGVL